MTTGGEDEAPDWVATTETSSRDGLQRIVACLMVGNLPSEALPELLDDLRITMDYYSGKSVSRAIESTRIEAGSPMPIAQFSTEEPELRFSE